MRPPLLAFLAAENNAGFAWRSFCIVSLEPPCRCGLRFGRLVHARELQRLVHVAVSTNDLPLLLIAVKLFLCEHDAEAAGADAPGATSSSSSLTLTEELKDLGTRYGALFSQL